MFKAFDKWLVPYLLQHRSRNVPRPEHVVIAVCDHFEPFHSADRSTALSRVREWRHGLKRLTESFVDSDGHPPKHTFFFPIEQYDEGVVSEIGEICRSTGSEGGVHLHHDNDNPEQLEEVLTVGRDRLKVHGLLGPDGRYPFIHGNWALDNSHPTGRHCGVAGELGILRRTGCYADFTMPSAPSPTQTRIINSIYYATSTNRPKSHDRGIPAGRASRRLRDEPDRLLLVQGPLGLNWKHRKLRLLPRVENGDLTGANPPSAGRLDLWIRLAPRLALRPDTAFIKLHTHGAVERNSATLLGEPMHEFHRALRRLGMSFHYATAREMVNIIHAFEEGRSSPPGDHRDHVFSRPCGL